MARDRKLSVTITADASKAQKALGDFEKSAAKSGKRTESALSGVKGSLLDLGVASAGLFAFNEFNEAEKVANQTAAALKSTGGAANVTADEVSGLAEALSEKAAVDDELIQSGANLLLTFTKVRNEAGKGNDIFNQATETALDLSVALGTDMSSASLMLGKALNDPIKGLTTLGRAGVQFTADQKEQIRTLVETGDVLSAQKIILAELETQVGGSAEAQATGYDRAKVAAGNLAETVGGVLAPAVEQAAGAAQAGAEWFQELSNVEQTAAVLAAGGVYSWLRWSDQIKVAGGAAKQSAVYISQVPSAMSAIGDLAATRGVGKGTAAFEVFKESVVGADTKAGKALTTFAKYPTTFGTAAGGAAVLSLALIDMAEDSKRAAKNAESLLDISEQLGGSLDDAFNQKLVNTIEQVAGGFDLGGSGDTFAREMDNAGISAKELQKALTGSEANFKRFVESTIASGDATDVFVQDLYDLRDAYDASEDKKKGVIETSKLLGVAVDETTGAFVDQTDAATELGDTVGDAYERIRNRADAAEEAIRSFHDEQLGQMSSEINALNALQDYGEALYENGITTGIATQKARDNKQSLIEYAEAAKQATADEYARTGSMEAARLKMDEYRLRLIDMQTQAGYTKDEIAFMVQEMGFNETGVFNIDNSGALAALDAVQQRIDSLSLGSVMAAVSGPYGQPSPPMHVGGQHSPPRASGGAVNAGDWYKVRESGDEFFRPGVGGSIVPVGPTRNAMAAGGSQAPIMVQVVLDKRVLGEVMVDVQNRRTRTDGRTPTLTTMSSVVR